MDSTPTVVALCGSLRDTSYTRIALRHVLDAAADAGAETRLVDFREMDLPLFDPNHDEQGDSEELKRIVREADSVILGTPVYHGSYSSALKSALDYLGFDEFEDTTVGLLATAGGGTYGSTLDHMRVVARGVHAWVLPHQVGIRRAYDAFEDSGASETQRGDGEAVDAEGEEIPQFEDQNLAGRVAKLGTQAVEYAHIEPEPVHVREQEKENVSADD